MTTDETRTLQCSGCQAELEIDAEYYVELAGTEIACPECDTSIFVPAPEEKTKPPKKRLGLRSADSAVSEIPSDAEDETHCPTCGAELPDPQTTLCIACGTNRVTGEQMTGIPAAGKKSRSRPPTTPRQAITGVVAVLVILGCAVRAYLLYTGKGAKEQTETLAYVIASARTSDDYADSVILLETMLRNCPKATNRDAAESILDWARTEAQQVATHTEAMTEAMARAREQLDRAEAIRILDVALGEHPGARNEQDARDLRDRLTNAP